MSFTISNIVYACQRDRRDDLLTKSNIITGVVDFALITSACTIGGLMLCGILNFGLPMGVGTIGNYIAWGCVGVGGGIAIADIITAIIIKSRKVTNMDSKRSQSHRPTAHLTLEKPEAQKKDDEVSPMQELHNFLFSTLINSMNIANVQPLGSLLADINNFLNNFNKKYNLNLQAIGSAHSSKKQDRWQTVKIIDLSIKEEGQVSIFLNELNDYLYEDFGIISNGGDSGSVIKGKKKQAPVCFIKAGVVMYPQIQISLIDIKRILGITSKDEYFQELKNAYIW